MVGDLNEGKPPISVKFEIPYFTTSGIQVGIVAMENMVKWKIHTPASLVGFFNLNSWLAFQRIPQPIFFSPDLFDFSTDLDPDPSLGFIIH